MILNKNNFLWEVQIMQGTVTFCYEEWIDTKNVVTMHAITAQIGCRCFKITPTKILQWVDLFISALVYHPEARLDYIDAENTTIIYSKNW